ncbi:MAG: sulfurtransferase complex subunit TusB [Roseiarcus sp.]
MSTLHIVNKSPYERVTLASCLSHLAPGDAVLIFEDGVLGARKGGAFAKRLSEAAATFALYVLGPDVYARGLKDNDLAEGVKVVGYDGFVDLAVDHARVCAWL